MGATQRVTRIVTAALPMSLLAAFHSVSKSNRTVATITSLFRRRREPLLTHVTGLAAAATAATTKRKKKQMTTSNSQCRCDACSCSFRQRCVRSPNSLKFKSARPVDYFAYSPASLATREFSFGLSGRASASSQLAFFFAFLFCFS